MNADQKFLVRVNNTQFFVEVDGQDISVTDTPSYATHMSYAQADQVCQRLQRRYRMCVVTNFFGKAMTFDEIHSELRLIAEEQAAHERAALPTTLAELSKIPAVELKRRFKGDPTFAARANELWHGKEHQA
jgi:hypothetical protein